MIETETEVIIMRIKSMIRSFLCISLSIAACPSFCACGSQPDAKQSETAAQETTVAQTDASLSEHRKIIIDTDTGADDASALILAAKQQNVEILGESDIGRHLSFLFGENDTLLDVNKTLQTVENSVEDICDDLELNYMRICA